MLSLASPPSRLATVALPRRNPSGKIKAVCRNFRGFKMRWPALPSHTPVATVESFLTAIRREHVHRSHDVFLNFRGKDNRKGLIDHLYNRLLVAKFSVFKDNSDLLSKQIGLGLFQAIENSKIAIPIISEHYGESKWCLNELSQIMNRHAEQDLLVSPVFYDIDVSDVHGQTGKFGKAFYELSKRHTPEQVQEWREALRSVTMIKGWTPREVANGHQGEVVNMVIEKISTTLSPPLIEKIPIFGKERRASKYEVFPISSPATKKTLASHLHYSLMHENMRVFSDDDQYLIGKDFAHEISNAMKHCKLFISIISEDFASSPDCLNNLTQMVECIKTNGSKILPIFYKVDPSQNQVWDRFHEDMLQHDVPQDTRQWWQESLNWVCSIGGLVSANIGNGDEGKLVIRATEKVCDLLKNLNA